MEYGTGVSKKGELFMQGRESLNRKGWYRMEAEVVEYGEGCVKIMMQDISG